jgi:hypothetical protein
MFDFSCVSVHEMPLQKLSRMTYMACTADNLLDAEMPCQYGAEVFEVESEMSYVVSCKMA